MEHYALYRGKNGMGHIVCYDFQDENTKNDGFLNHSDKLNQVKCNWRSHDT